MAPGRYVCGSVGEHTKVAGICTKPGQFSQPCRAAGGGYASAGRLLSGRCKKTFEFASKRPKTGKNVAGITHRKHPILHRKISLCVAASRPPGMESRTEQLFSALDVFC